MVNDKKEKYFKLEEKNNLSENKQSLELLPLRHKDN